MQLSDEKLLVIFVVSIPFLGSDIASHCGLLFSFTIFTFVRCECCDRSTSGGSSAESDLPIASF